MTYHQWGSSACTSDQFHRINSRIQSATWIRKFLFEIFATSPRTQWDKCTRKCRLPGSERMPPLQSKQSHGRRLTVDGLPYCMDVVHSGCLYLLCESPNTEWDSQTDVVTLDQSPRQGKFFFRRQGNTQWHSLAFGYKNNPFALG